MEITATYIGGTSIRRFFADLDDAVPDIQLHMERADLVGSNVLAFERGSVSGRASGVAGEVEFTTLYELVDERVRRIGVFVDREKALEAAGRSE